MRYLISIVLFLFSINYSYSQWCELNSGTEQNLADFTFIDQNTAIIVGEEGIILKTTNAGITWNTIDSIGTHIADVYMCNEYTGYIAGNDGLVFKTIDGGENWFQLESGVQTIIRDIHFVNEDTGFYCGQRQIIARTIDGGASWDTTSYGPWWLREFKFLDDQIGYCMGDGGHIHRTDNCGQSWYQINSGTENHIRDFVFPHPDTGYATGNFGTIIKTTDGGLTWSNIYSGTTENLLGIWFNNSYEGYAMGKYGVLLHTIDGGDSWDNIDLGYENGYRRMIFTDSVTGYIIGSEGLILKTCNDPATFNTENLCMGDSTNFFINFSIEPDSVIWNFGDPESGSYNISRLINPKHMFSSPGNYQVALITFNYAWSDTITEYITIKPLPQIDLGNDTILCSVDTFNIEASGNYDYIFWNNGSNSNSITIDQDGLYWAEVSLNGCINSDSIQLSFFADGELELGNDTSLCPGENCLIDLGSAHDTYLWQDGSTEQYFNITEAGTYWAEVSNYCGFYSDTIVVDYYELPDFSIGPDTSICESDSITYSPDINYLDLVWSDQSSDENFTANETGIYWLELTDLNGCLSYDTAFLTVIPLPCVDIGPDTTIYRGSIIHLFANSDAHNFFWSTGETTQEISIDSIGEYWVEVNNFGCYAYDTISIFEYPSCILDIPTAFTPNNDGNNDILFIRGSSAQNVHLMIFNRSGEMVFESFSINDGWDGTYKGKIQPVDVYNYILTGICEDGQSIKHQGSVVILQ